VLSGRFKVRVGDEERELDRGGFAFLPSGLPHAFLNLTDEPAEVIVVYTPGGGRHFYAELGPLTRNGAPDPADVAACFTRHGMALIGPPGRGLVSTAAAKSAPRRRRGSACERVNPATVRPRSRRSGTSGCPGTPFARRRAP